MELLGERPPFPAEMLKVGGALCTKDGSSAICSVITDVIKVRGSHFMGPSADLFLFNGVCVKPEVAGAI